MVDLMLVFLDQYGNVGGVFNDQIRGILHGNQAMVRNKHSTWSRDLITAWLVRAWVPMNRRNWFTRVAKLQVLAFRRTRERSVRLLMDNLSAQQRQEYEAHRYFHVIGGVSRTAYRLRHGRMLNVEELGAHGEVVSWLCFSPKGRLPIGDVLLAQKIALELFEFAALKAATRHLPNQPVIP
jgi:hypothetical protein